jgi:hypothetical protein
MNGSILLRIVAIGCFALLVILIVAKASLGTFEEVLLPSGLLAWCLSTVVP